MSFAKPSSLPQRLLLAAILLGGTAGSARAGIFPIPLGGNGTLRAELGAELRYDDNLYLSSILREADFVASATPGLRLNWSGSGATSLGANVATQLVRYVENPEENTSLWSYGISAGRAGGHTQLDFSASYNQIKSNSRDFQAVRQLVRYDATSVQLGLARPLSARLNFDASVSATGRDFKTSRYTSSRDVAFNTGLSRTLTPWVEGGLGYSFRQVSYPGSTLAEYGEHTLSLDAYGDFTSTLSGRIGLGTAHQTGNTSDLGDPLRLNLSVRWTPDARTALSLALSRNMQPSNTSAGMFIDTSGTISLSREFSARVSAQVAVTRQQADYSGRLDVYDKGTLSLQFTASDRMQFSWMLEREVNASDSVLFDYTRQMTSLSASFQF